MCLALKNAHLVCFRVRQTEKEREKRLIQRETRLEREETIKG
jgi:hypothetical protein